MKTRSRSQGASCPKCSAPGRKVPATTLRAIVKPESLDGLSIEESHFCASGECPIVYYDDAGKTLAEDAALVRIGAKHTDDASTLCYCFGYTLGDVRREALRGPESTIATEIRARIASEGCSCETSNPSGICCLADVDAAVHAAQPRPTRR